MLSGTTATAAITAAVSEWREALGTAYVSTDAEDLLRSGVATFPTASTVTAIIRPANRADVQRCVRIANRFQCPALPDQHGEKLGIWFALAGTRRGAPRPRQPQPHHRTERRAGVCHARARRDPAAAARPSARERIAAVDGRDRRESRLQHHRQHARTRIRAHADGRPLQPRMRV